jgi:hypothetical protein
MLRFAKKLLLVKIFTLSWECKRTAMKTILKKPSKRELSRSTQIRTLTQKQRMLSKKSMLQWLVYLTQQNAGNTIKWAVKQPIMKENNAPVVEGQASPMETLVIL